MMLALTTMGYEIMQYSICEGWINNLYDGNDCPYVFSTMEEAVAELQEEFDDWQVEIKTGERDKKDRYDISAFRIVCKDTGVTYVLDIVAGKVAVIFGITNN